MTPLTSSPLPSGERQGEGSLRGRNPRSKQKQERVRDECQCFSNEAVVMGVFRTSIQVSQEGAIAYHTRAETSFPAEPILQEYAFKRMMDFTLASIGLVVSATLWLLIACAVKLEDGGPVFYLQHRWGQNKVPFKVYKFRSMVADADKRFGAVQADENDPRYTRVGGWLRATSLDELPQLVNIWKGEMSWVGPRALPMNEKQVKEGTEVPDEAVPGFDLRCLVRPGLTGIAQIFAPRDVPRRHKFRYDLLYIRRQSLALDLKLIALSLWITLRGRWESRGKKL
jgi:lipopolysaccharide/colanic/teichoic acid biosynthesis glycosyltransferase